MGKRRDPYFNTKHIQGYESHAEVNLIMTSLKKIAKRYFEYADPKYKTEAFWYVFAQSASSRTIIAY